MDIDPRRDVRGINSFQGQKKLVAIFWVWKGTHFGRNRLLHGNGYNIQGTNLRNKKPMIRRNVDIEKFVDLLKIK